MSEFLNIKKGDSVFSLNVIGRNGGWARNEKFILNQWIEHKVEDVARVYFTINGEKYRKDDPNFGFHRRYYVPGTTLSSGLVVPDKATDLEEVKAFEACLTNLRNIPSIVYFENELKRFNDITLASEFAEKFTLLLNEMESAIKSST